MPFPPPSQDVDFNAFIYTSTPFYATATDKTLTQLPSPDFSEPRVHSETPSSMSPPPLFIGSSDDGIMEMPLDVLPSQEKVEDGGLSMAGEEVEINLPELPPKTSVVVEKTRPLMEIPDSDAESETSSSVNGGPVVEEKQDSEVAAAGHEKDMIFEHENVVGQEMDGVEDPNDDPMNDMKESAISFVGTNGDMGSGHLGTYSTHETGESTTANLPLMDPILNDKERTINGEYSSNHINATSQPQLVVADDHMELNPLNGMMSQYTSHGEPNPLHMAISHMGQEYNGELPNAIAAQQAHLDPLGETQQAEDLVENVAIGSRSDELVNLESARSHDIMNTQISENTPHPFHSEAKLYRSKFQHSVPRSPSKHAEDLTDSREEKLQREKHDANVTTTDRIGENHEIESYTSTLDNEILRPVSAESEGTQTLEYFPVEDEVNLITTENSSKVDDAVTEVPVDQDAFKDAIMQDADSTQKEAYSLVKDTTLDISVTSQVDDVTMEDVVQQRKQDIADSAATEEAVPRSARRASSRKSDKTLAAGVPPKQGLRRSAGQAASIDSEVTEPQASVGNSETELDKSLEPLHKISSGQDAANIKTDVVISEKKPTRKASSRKKGEIKTGAEEVPAFDPIAANMQDDTEKFKDNILAPVTATETQVSKESSKKSVTRRKSHRATRTEKDVSVRADTPAPIEEVDEVDENDIITAPAPEPLVETSTLKMLQRKGSSTSRKASGRAAKRNREEEVEEQPEDVDETVPEASNLDFPEPEKPAVPQRPVAPTQEGSQSKDVLIAELKAMKIASIQARTASLEAEIAAKRAKVEEITKELTQPAADTVKRHIKLLHDYNDIRDVGQALVGMIADNRGVRISELYDEFGVGLKD